MGGESRSGIRKRSVRETVTEREERGERQMIVMAITDVETFAIERTEVFAWPGVVGWVI